METYDSAFTRPPAPPPLDIVQAFLNSVDLEDGTEAFATVASLEAWVAQRLPDAGGSFTEEDRLRAMRLREALRDVVEHGVQSVAASALQQEVDDIPLIMRISSEDPPDLVAVRNGIEALFASVMAGAYHAMIDGTWKRLKICNNDVCRWAFYDASKNQSGVWCSMATCGSKAKARAYRSRTRQKESR